MEHSEIDKLQYYCLPIVTQILGVIFCAVISGSNTIWGQRVMGTKDMTQKY